MKDIFEKNKLTAKFVEDLEGIIRKELIDKLPKEIDENDQYEVRTYNDCLKEIKQLIKE